MVKLYGYKRDALEIITNKHAANKMTHRTINNTWRDYLVIKNELSDEQILSDDDPERTEKVLEI